ncbi:MAG: cytochrome c [Hyphomicrobiaceae bacterium]|nr:cytochrome c [Hyphomicrobiaceae bacterium]
MATRTGKPIRRLRPGPVLSWLVGVPLVLVVVAALGAAVLRGNPAWFVAMAERLMPRRPVEAFANDKAGDVEHFKYGAIGNEAADGLPLKIWRVLPQVCPQLLPVGAPRSYEAFGFTFERDGATGRLRETPIGLSRTRLGLAPLDIEVLAINCATCHVQTYALPGDREPRIFVGGASNRLDAQGYTRFVAACAETRGFDADVLVAAMDAREQLSWPERLMYRHLVVPVARELIRDRLGSRFHWTWSRPAWGPGRLSPFNPVKFDYLGQPVDSTIDHGDVMPAWNVTRKEAMRSPTPWHWDGLSWDLKEVVLNSALGDGMTRFGYREETIERLLAYLRELRSPPSPMARDTVLEARGAALFAAECASCHAAGGKRIMSIIPRAEIGTDPNRIDMWTPQSAAAYNNYDRGSWRSSAPWYARAFDWTLDRLAGRPHGLPWEFTRFQKHEGYLAQPLDGIWLTGPYLHNGSVPTLDDLLKPAAERPRAFVRGLDQLDLVRGGYVSPPCEPERYVAAGGFCYDTTLAGNGNFGHEYGTRLSLEDRRALVHYLLTL